MNNQITSILPFFYYKELLHSPLTNTDKHYTKILMIKKSTSLFQRENAE